MLLVTYVVFSGIVNAQGIAAGVTIENKATVTYAIAGDIQEPIESSPVGNKRPGIGGGEYTSFIVDRKIDLNITSHGDSKVSLGETQAELNFTLSNDGNDIQEFLLITDSLVTTDDFDSNNCKVKITAVTGTPLEGVILPSFDNIKLSPDQQASISVKCDIPFDNNGNAILNDQKALLIMYAITSKNKDGSATKEEIAIDSAENIETVFADDAGTDDIKRDASHSTRAAYIAQVTVVDTPPTLNIDKTILSVIDPQGGNKAVSGSEVTYKISVTSAGKGTINHVVISDKTPSGMTYKTGSMVLNDRSLSDINDADKGEFNELINTVKINIGDITAGTNPQKIKLTYIIN